MNLFSMLLYSLEAIDITLDRYFEENKDIDIH